MTVAGMAGIITKARGGMLVFLGWGGGNWGLKWLRESVVMQASFLSTGEGCSHQRGLYCNRIIPSKSLNKLNKG